MGSRTEDYVRNSVRPALRRHFQPIALRVIAEGGGSVEIARIRQAIQARHPGTKWDRRYPIKVLEDNGIVKVSGTNVSFVEELGPEEIASLLAALDERAVRTSGLRVEDTSWRPDQAEWRALRRRVIERHGDRCAVLGCEATGDLHLDHIWRGSLLAAVGWSPSAINDPTNLQLLCPVHHADKTAHEVALLAADDGIPKAER
jgi:5-methylcytosine-specific restriction endonuclease McrA